MKPGATYEENLRILVEEMKVPPSHARFILAIETGKIKGDIVMVDKDGNETGAA